jgi:hypothetical protein
MTDNTEAWGTEAQTREYTGKIVDAQFGYDERFGGGQKLLLLLDIETDHGYTRHDIITTGDGWTTKDKGATAVYEGDKPKTQFGKGSNMGKFVDAVLAIDGALDVLKTRGTPTEAATWQGLTFYWEEFPYTFKDRDTGLDVQRTRMLPTQLIGGTTSNGTIPDVEGLTPALYAQLKGVAAKSLDHDDFVDKAFNDIDMDDKQTVSVFVLDAGNWNF